MTVKKLKKKLRAAEKKEVKLYRQYVRLGVQWRKALDLADALEAKLATRETA